MTLLIDKPLFNAESLYQVTGLPESVLKLSKLHLGTDLKLNMSNTCNQKKVKSNKQEIDMGLNKLQYHFLENSPKKACTLIG